VQQGAVIPDAGVAGVTRLATAIWNGNIVGGVNKGPTNGSGIVFDGQLVTAFTDSTDATDQQTNLRIGFDGDDNPYDGAIAEFVVFGRALSTSELALVNNFLGSKYARNFQQAP